MVCLAAGDYYYDLHFWVLQEGLPRNGYECQQRAYVRLSYHYVGMVLFRMVVQ